MTHPLPVYVVNGHPFSHLEGIELDVAFAHSLADQVANRARVVHGASFGGENPADHPELRDARRHLRDAIKELESAVKAACSIYDVFGDDGPPDGGRPLDEPGTDAEVVAFPEARAV